EGGVAMMRRARNVRISRMLQVASRRVAEISRDLGVRTADFAYGVPIIETPPLKWWATPSVSDHRDPTAEAMGHAVGSIQSLAVLSVAKSGFTFIQHMSPQGRGGSDCS
ncbi:MAG: hypothetical protein KDA32_15525, partial [Phycisphaerales bacterium]|nr:hypothetical protein [Phycisphaerales bacterium]